MVKDQIERWHFTMWPSVVLTVGGLAGVVVSRMLELGTLPTTTSLIVVGVGIIAVFSNMGRDHYSRYVGSD